MQGQDLQAFFLDVVFFLVDFRISIDHLLGQLNIAFLQRANGLVDRFFDCPRLREDVTLQVLEISFQVFRHLIVRCPA